jgi:uncharacterized protein YbjQ (UPF0145 family)
MHQPLLVFAIASLVLPACDGMNPARGPSSPATHVAAASAHHGEGSEEDDHDDDHDDDHAPLPRDPATVAAAGRVHVLQSDSMGCESEVLGLVDVHSHMHETEHALDELKLRAAALGAEAVLGVDFHHGEGGHEPTHLSGIAARCRDLRRGRSYDVIQELDVTGKNGHEDDAFQALRERARAVHADLVVGIEFHHGDGTEPSHVTGTAVRWRTSGEGT